MTQRRVNVAVAVALDRGFDYEVPASWPVVPAAGTRVLVPLGARVLVGIVRPVPPLPEPPPKLKAVLDVLDEDGPAITPELQALCEWISDYYLGPIGEVYRLALPGLLTHADARSLRIAEAGTQALVGGGPLLGTVELSPAQRRVLEFVATHKHAGCTLPAVVRKLGARGVAGIVAGLQERGLIEVWWQGDEEVRTETWVRRTQALREGADEGELQRVLGRSKQRRRLLDTLEQALGDEQDGWVSLAQLRGPFPRIRELLPALEGASLVESQSRPRALDPFACQTPVADAAQAPTQDQAAALIHLGAAFERDEFASILLQGITGSGKTEVYLQFIAKVREAGRSAIVLVPEIALTPQLADRFRARFKDEVAVLHSGLTPRQRLDAWQQIRAGLRPIVIGARSAVFAPVPSLGAIVVDEEHDSSFKQEEGVRYHGRDVALMRAKQCGAVVVLGSATPSLETYALAQQGRHQWLRLRTRPTPRPLPEVEVLSLAVHRADPESLLTARLREAVIETVSQGEQAILFLNRRGFTTSLVCETCGSRQQCPDCSAPSMTYHLGRQRLLCHLCGHVEAAADECKQCGATGLTHTGAGTERVEIAVARALPNVRVLRLDRDAARGRAMLQTLAAFRRHEADVLVGTQMLSKGHDFPGVTLVGILQGDHGLAIPDPRAAERTFALLTQVAGRAGRGDRPGRVIIQAWAVEHPAIAFAQRHDFDGFAGLELEHRRAVHNPPWGYLALLRIQGISPQVVAARARALGQGLERAAAQVRAKHNDPLAAVVLGPVPSPIERIDQRTRWQVLVRTLTRAPMRWILGELRGCLGAEGSGAQMSYAQVDVDPQSML